MIVSFCLGGTVLDYDVDTDTVVAGPRPLDEAFPGSAAHGVDDVDAVLDIGNGHTYLFRGPDYLRTEFGGTAVEARAGITDAWGGMGAAGFDRVDAAMNWGDGKVYFFRGPDYVRYDIAADRVDAGYPKPIAGNWRGFEAGWVGDGVDAALFAGGDRAWVFRGTEYVGVSWSRKARMPGYPVDIGAAWTGLADVGFTAGVAAWAAATTMTPSGDLSDAFVAGVLDVAAAIGCAPTDLLGVMMSESGIDPSAQNPHGRATGLIQFMPQILGNLGWTDGPDDFAKLAAEDQLPYVQKYFGPHAHHGLTSAGRLYQVTYLPATMGPGQGPDFVISAADGPFAREYAANRGLDTDQNGRITVADLDARIAAVQRGARWDSLAARL